jgi:thiamine biosynthesis lipoprotein ApbE
MEAARNRAFTGGQEVDDRPWFQMIKRRKSVTGTVNQENMLDNQDSNRNNNYNKRIETAAPFEYRVRDDKQLSRSNDEGHNDAISAPKQDMTVYQDAASTRTQGAFRSGLQLLTELET